MPTAAMSDNPVQLSIELQQDYSRGLAVLGCIFLIGRAFALIPIYFVLYFFGIVAFALAWIVQFAVLFTGKYPQGAHTFLAGYIRWEARLLAWLMGLVDKYPTSMQP